jgi:hypothetical protein
VTSAETVKVSVVAEPSARTRDPERVVGGVGVGVELPPQPEIPWDKRNDIIRKTTRPVILLIPIFKNSHGNRGNSRKEFG